MLLRGGTARPPLFASHSRAMMPPWFDGPPFRGGGCPEYRGSRLLVVDLYKPVADVAHCKHD